MYNKKGVVTITTYSLIIVLLLLLLVFSFYFQSKFEDEAVNNIDKIECLNSASMLRSALVKITKHDNLNITYYNPNDVSEIYFELSEGNITAVKETDIEFVRVTVPTLTYRFCEDYTTSPHLNNSYHFNGSCVSLYYSE
ncbi:MAG: hypothetical protein ACOCXG_01785 [Nanoarchaeota archaeon]